MPFSSTKRGSPSERLFLSAKAATTIPIQSDLHHNALCQCALDPTVTRIEFFACVKVGTVACPLNTIAIIRDGRRLVLEIGDNPTPRDLDQEGLYLLALEKLSATPLNISTRDISREPHHSNVRLVWSYHDRRASIASRNRILRLIEDTGPVTIKVLCHDLGSDLTADVYALACQSTLYLDLTDRPVSGATIVRSKHVLRSPRPSRHDAFGKRQQ
jgi:hypothetical protein